MTCLVVDESATIRRICRRVLEGIGCESVLEAGSRADTEAHAETVPDLVIIGRQLEDGDSLDFVRRFRRNEKTSHVPVLMISDQGQRAAVVAASEAGVSSYLLRPFQLPLLQKRIEALLGEEMETSDEPPREAAAEADAAEEEPEAKAA